jgi:hypothetical protein
LSGAFASSNIPSRETASAIETEGRSEIERIAQLDDLPRVVKCSTTVVGDVYADKVE